jgi:hypothetical protein
MCGMPRHKYYYCYGCTALCWTLTAVSVSWSYTHSVGLLGRGISPSQGRYLHREQHKHRTNSHNTDIHAFSGIRIHDPSVRVSKDSLCLRRRGQCDQQLYFQKKKIFTFFFFFLDFYNRPKPLKFYKNDACYQYDYISFHSWSKSFIGSSIQVPILNIASRNGVCVFSAFLHRSRRCAYRQLFDTFRHPCQSHFYRFIVKFRPWGCDRVLGKILSWKPITFSPCQEIIALSWSPMLITIFTIARH